MKKPMNYVKILVLSVSILYKKNKMLYVKKEKKSKERKLKDIIEGIYL